MNNNSINGEVKNLLEMFEYYLTQRQLKKPIAILNEAVHDMRIILQRLLLEYFLELNETEEPRFCSSLATLLADRCEAIPDIDEDDTKYFAYVIGEILTCFEQVQEIKEENPGNPHMQKTLTLDMPLLRPFDYGIRPKIRIIKSK